MDGRGRSDDRRQEGEESQEERIERKRREAGEQERDSAAGPGYTARPSDEEPEEEPAGNGG
jgi:hypothetical protein